VRGSTPPSATSPHSRQRQKPHNPVSTFPGEGHPLDSTIFRIASVTAWRVANVRPHQKEPTKTELIRTVFLHPNFSKMMHETAFDAMDGPSTF
jgi:hypothetical protein